MDRHFQSRRQLFCVLSILGVALGLRLLGLGFGLPYSYVVDEYHEVMRAMALGAGSFDLERTGKGGFYYLLFLEYGFYFVFLKLAGAVGSASDFAVEFVRNPTPFYYMGRVTAALFGAGSVLGVYLLARRAYTVGAATLAAVFLAFNALHVDLSKVIGVDVMMTFFVLVALLKAVDLARYRSRSDYLLAAVFASIATTTKTPAILLLVPLLIAHTYAVRASGGGAREWFTSRNLHVAAAAFTALLVVTNPGLVIYGYQYLNLFAAGAPDPGVAAAAEDALQPYVERPNLYLFYLRSLRDSMGWPLLLVGIAGAIYGLWKRTPADVILISFALLFYLAISSTTSQHLYYTRYVLPPMVVLLVLGGRLVYDIWKVSDGARVWTLGLFAGILVAAPAVRSVSNSYVLTRPDTRTLAKEWIDRNVPYGASVFIEGTKIAPVRSGVNLQETAEGLRRRIEYWSVVEPRQAEFLEIRLKAVEGPAFDLEMAYLAEFEDLDTYLERGVEYFVIMPDRYMEDRNRTPRTERLIHDLRTSGRATLIKRFDADPGRRPGPTIEIYRAEPPPSDSASVRSADRHPPEVARGPLIGLALLTPSRLR